MNCTYYDLHSWRELYHKELLQEAQRRHLAHQARAHRRPPGAEVQVRWSWLGKLAAAIGFS
jgi:hypothetical protein